MASHLLSATVECLPAMESREPSEKAEWQGLLEGWLCGGSQCGELEALIKSQAVLATLLRALQNWGVKSAWKRGIARSLLLGSKGDIKWALGTTLNVWHKFFHVKRGLRGNKELLEILAQSLWGMNIKRKLGSSFCRLSCGLHEKKKCMRVLLDPSYLPASVPETMRATVLVRAKACINLCPALVASWVKGKWCLRTWEP